MRARTNLGRRTPLRRAVEALRAYFDAHRDRVFSSRQVEVAFEDTCFHWVTHRALNLLAEEGALRREQRKLATGTPATFVWHRSNRYTRRQLRDVQALIERYSDPAFTAALGQTGELLVSDGLGRFQRAQRRRDVREYAGRRWTTTTHTLDFRVARDGRVYGVEVKNTAAIHPRRRARRHARAPRAPQGRPAGRGAHDAPHLDSGGGAAGWVRARAQVPPLPAEP